jgi:hypothetical protein
MKTDILKIEQAKYSGYLWYSDKTTPDIIEKDFSLEINSNTNPFIIEGQLFDGTNSISIKYVDGSYYVNKTTVDKNNSSDDIEFISHRMKGKKLVFTQLWVEKKMNFVWVWEHLFLQGWYLKVLKRRNSYGKISKFL